MLLVFGHLELLELLRSCEVVRNLTRVKTEHDCKILEVLVSVPGDGKDIYLKETKITIGDYFPLREEVA